MAEISSGRRHACGSHGFVPLESFCNFFHQKALLSDIQGTVFNSAKINNAKIKGYEHVTLKVEKPHTTQDSLSKKVRWSNESIY